MTIVSFSGIDGAGKSTLMRTVATLQSPDSGTVNLDGLDVLSNKNEVRKVLGYLPQEFGVYPKISGSMALGAPSVEKPYQAAKVWCRTIRSMCRSTKRMC